MTDEDGSVRAPKRWLWVAGPDYYLEDGKDRSDLDPGPGYEPSAWWTCDPAARIGDLALLYRSRVRKDIAHVLAVRSNPEVIDEPGTPFHGWHACSYEVVERLPSPVTFTAIAEDPQLQHWGPVKLKFVKSSFPVPPEHWARLIELGGEDAEGVERQARDGLRRIRLEREIQQRLIDYPALLARAGYEGIELVRAEHRFADGTRADLLYTQGRGLRRRHVVVELKRGQITLAAVSQVLRYRRLLDQDGRWPTRRAHAVVIGDTLHPEAARQVASTRRLSFVPLSALRLTRQP